LPIGECQFFLGNASCDVNEIYARGLTPEQMAEAGLDVDALYDRAISAVVLPRKTAFLEAKNRCGETAEVADRISAGRTGLQACVPSG